MTGNTTGLRLYNTKARAKQDFTPIDPSNVRMYVCGPTVYDRAHLGNARPVIVFDTLFRLLRHVYGADHVTYVRNFTDVDDKINAEALRRQKAGAAGTLEDLIRERTEETIAWYHADMDALGALRPSMEPRATEFIGQMVTMIQGLIASDHAYAAEGHVLFAVDSYKDYGKLSGRTVDDMIAGARVEVAPYKRNPMDFVLWKPSSGEEPGWASPWGKGRPGWHIECSAMAHELLGESFDIHGGGLDLQFPHHENEIAQSACAHPHGDFARVWMHNEMLQVEGKKMSKSLGNFFTVRDLLEGNTPDGVRYPGEVIRFVFLMTHYRSPMDWTAEKARQAEMTLRKWRAATATVAASAPLAGVVEALADDLNTAGALAALHAAAGEADWAGVKASAELLGLLEDGMGAWLVARPTFSDLLAHPERYPEQVAKLQELNATIQRTIEAQLASIRHQTDGFASEIGKFLNEFADECSSVYGDQPVHREVFERAKKIGIASLLEQRSAAKKAKNYAEADRIRGVLAAEGFKVIDTSTGARWIYDY